MPTLSKRRVLSAAWVVSAALAFWLGVSQDRRGQTKARAGDAIPPPETRKPPARQMEEPGEESGTARSSGTPLLARMRAALADPVTQTRQREWIRCLDEAGAAEMEAGADMLRPGLRQYRWTRFEAPALWNRWLELDSGCCMKYILKNPEVKNSNTVQLVDAALRWARSDLPAACAFLKSATPGQLPGEALRGLLQGWAAADLTAATAYVFDPKQDAAIRRPDAAQALAMAAWETQGVAGTTRWFEAVSQRPGDSLSFLQDAFGYLTRRNPEVTANPEFWSFLKTQRGKLWWDDQAITTAFLSLRSGGPDQVLEAVAALGPDPATGRHSFAGLSYAMMSMTRNGPAAPEAWLRAHTDSPLYDEMAATYVRSLRMDENAETAERWLATIKDDKLRQEIRRR